MDAQRAHMAAGSAAGRLIRRLDKYVVYRFLRPSLRRRLRNAGLGGESPRGGAGRAVVCGHGTPCLYRFVDEGAASSCIRWHSVSAPQPGHRDRLLSVEPGHLLQRNNPNVPNIAGKLAEPEWRDLSGGGFWRTALAVRVPCAASIRAKCSTAWRRSITSCRGVSWRTTCCGNIARPRPASIRPRATGCPTSPAISRPLPRSGRGRAGGGTAGAQWPLLEDYILLLKTPSVDALRGVPFAHFRRVLEDTLAPQMQIARTMGFAAGWSYTRMIVRSPRNPHSHLTVKDRKWPSWPIPPSICWRRAGAGPRCSISAAVRARMWPSARAGDRHHGL